MSIVSQPKFHIDTIPGVNRWIQLLYYLAPLGITGIILNLENPSIDHNIYHLVGVLFVLSLMPIYDMIILILKRKDFPSQQAKVNELLANQDTFLKGVEEAKLYYQDLISVLSPYLDIFGAPFVYISLYKFEIISFDSAVSFGIAISLRGLYFLYIRRVYLDKIVDLYDVEIPKSFNLS